MSANPTSAIGGKMASSGLPARIASACDENAAVHTAVTAASIRGGSGGVGATRTRACWPTNSSERPIARSVRIDGRPYHAVCGRTIQVIASASPTRLASVASSNPRRSNRAAIATDASAAATSSSVACRPVNTRPNASAVATDRPATAARPRSRW